MPKDEKSVAQIRKVFELLVVTHPSYGEFKEKDGWALTQKLPAQTAAVVGKVKTHVVYEKVLIEKEYVGLGGVLMKILRKMVLTAGPK